MLEYRELTRLAAILAAAALLGACGDGKPRIVGEAPDPEERLPGGDTTNALLLGSNAFTRPAHNVSEEHELAFYTGNSFFNQSWVQAPSSTEARDGLGPLFNARSCAACHFKDGRGRPPLQEDEGFLGLLLRLSVPDEDDSSVFVPEPSYGGQLQPLAINGVNPEGTPRVTYSERIGHYADGESYTLLVPSYEVVNPAYGGLHDDLRISPRVAPAVIGLGLLEAIPTARLKGLADPDDSDADGISGRVNLVIDVETNQQVVGRFGWKAEQPSVRQQSAGAFLGDMGITTSLFSEQDCTRAESDCSSAPSGGEPEISDELLDKVVLYARLLAVPVRREWDTAEVLHGRALFFDSGCGDCHVARHQTASDADLPELRDQVIYPYTDLLLHDMGPDLSDQRPSFLAQGSEWRTPPLWGLGRYEEVNGHNRLLHDGRARGVAEAVLWHGGEARAARENFMHMPKSDREALIRFVESL